MAYCRNCGAEISNEAYVCTHCGVLVKENKKNEKLFLYHTASFWLLFSTIIWFFISFCVLLWSMFESTVLVYNSGGYIQFNYNLLTASATFAMIEFVLALCTFITSFSPERNGICSKTYIFSTLLVFLCSTMYLILIFIFVS